MRILFEADVKDEKVYYATRLATWTVVRAYAKWPQLTVNIIGEDKFAAHLILLCQSLEIRYKLYSHWSESGIKKLNTALRRLLDEMAYVENEKHIVMSNSHQKRDMRYIAIRDSDAAIFFHDGRAFRLQPGSSPLKDALTYSNLVKVASTCLNLGRDDLPLWKTMIDLTLNEAIEKTEFEL